MPGIAPYKRTLAANARTSIDARGTTIFVRKTSEELLVSPRSTQVGGGDGVQYSVRMSESEKWFTAEEFDSVEIRNEGSAETEVEILIGYGDFFRPVPDIVNVQVSSDDNNVATTAVDETNIDIGNAGAVQLLAQDNTRVQAWITALAGNAEEIRIGDANVDTDQGTPLQPGDTILWSSKGPCFACSIATNNQGAAVTTFTQ